MIKIIFAVFLVFPTLALAEGGKKGVCRESMRELCGQHKGDRESFKACIAENKDKIPQECKDRAKKWRKHKKGKGYKQETSES